MSRMLAAFCNASKWGLSNFTAGDRAATMWICPIGWYSISTQMKASISAMFLASHALNRLAHRRQAVPLVRSSRRKEFVVRERSLHIFEARDHVGEAAVVLDRSDPEAIAEVSQYGVQVGDFVRSEVDLRVFRFGLLHFDLLARHGLPGR